MDEEAREKASSLIASKRRVVAFCGAGISTESGIPDFRSPGGIWEKYTPVLYDEFLRSSEARKRYWRMHRELYPLVARAEPNEAHYALRDLEKLGRLDCVITQNIDGLHHRAGSSADKIIELHGTALWVHCLQCGARHSRQEVQTWLEGGVEEPLCPQCQGPMKPSTISFGQAMPEKELSLSIELSSKAEVFIVIGSSLVVYPAAQLPFFALQGGAKLIIINLAETPLDSKATLLFRDKAAQVLPAIVEGAREKLSDLSLGKN